MRMATHPLWNDDYWLLVLLTVSANRYHYSA